MGAIRRPDPALRAVEHADLSGVAAQFLRGMDELAVLKQQQGRDIYLMGGATITAAALDAELVDELRLIVYPLIAGEGSALFATPATRRALELRTVEQQPNGLLSLVYGIGRD